MKVFSFDRVQHAGARFDWEKLNWINGEWIRAMEDAELVRRLKPFLPDLDGATILRAVPALVFTSDGLTPEVFSLTRTSPGPGCGVSTSATCSTSAAGPFFS